MIPFHDSQYVVCPICGKKWQQFKKSMKYCSPECIREGRRRAVNAARMRFYYRNRDKTESPED